MNEMIRFYAAISAGLTLIAIGGYLAGAWACFGHRRLSRWLVTASAGFAGKSLSSAIAQFNAIIGWKDLEHIYQISLMAGLIDLTSIALLVFGLGMALAEVRRKLAVSMEPKHDWS